MNTSKNSVLGLSWQSCRDRHAGIAQVQRPLRDRERMLQAVADAGRLAPLHIGART
jgi:hypothetical protein